MSGVLKDGKYNLWNKSYFALISEELSGHGIKSKVEDIAEKIGINRSNVKINKEYIDAKNMDMSILGGTIIIVVFVMICSVLVIYSIFYVSILSRVHEFGKLRAIGATKKQIKGIVFREGIIIGFMFIPVGIFLGSIVGNLAVDKVINQGIYNIKGANFMVFLSVFVLCLLTVFIALAKPMKIAARISTIDAIRFDGENVERKKERKGYEFLAIGRLTYANIVRNKKRTIITIVSLSLSGILFMSISTIMSSISGEGLVKSHMKGEFLLTLSNYTHGEGERPILSDFNIIQLNNPLGEKIRNQVLQLPGVSAIERIGSVWTDLELPSGEIERNGLGGFDEDGFQWIEENLIEGDINYDRMMSGEGLIFTYPDFVEEYGVKVGERIKLKIYDGYNAFYKEFVVEGIASIGGDVFLIPNSALYNIVETDITNQVEIMVEEDYIEQVNLSLKAIADSNEYIELKTMSDEIENYEQLMGIIKTLGYCLVIIIGIIAFINLVNTMIASVVSRRREFGILQAVGLSNKQLVKMIQMEGVFYSVGMLIISLTVGNLAAYIGFEVFVSYGANYA
ncbi:MAG: FtsX-like permease family protein, partial [Clostridium sp.]